MSIKNSTWNELDYQFQLTAKFKIIQLLINACLGRKYNCNYSDIIENPLPHTKTDEKLHL